MSVKRPPGDAAKPPCTVTPPHPDVPAILSGGVWHFKSGYHYEIEYLPPDAKWTIVFGDASWERLKNG